MNARKFSMIEVMAVVAVMSTLSALMITSIKTSKDVAIQAACMSNISQIRNVAELHRKDNGKLPYSEIWMTDFSFASSYLKEGDALNIFKCPGSNDDEVERYSQLTYNTSYYYIPNGRLLQQNIADGSNYGITPDQIDELIASQNGVIYDKSHDHHNGKINIAYLFKDDENDADLQGAQGTITSIGNSNLLDLDGANIINLPELPESNEPPVVIVEDNPEIIADNNDPVADDNPEIVADNNDPEIVADNNDPVADDNPEIVADNNDPVAEDPVVEEPLAYDEEVDYEVTGDAIVVNEDVIATYKVLGAAISYGGRYDMAVTTQFQITDASGTTNPDAGFGDYGSVTNGNVNDGEQHEFTPEEAYEAGSIIRTEATSWQKTSSSRSGERDSHWVEYMEIDSDNSTNAMALTNGERVPNIDGYLDQGDVESFLDGYVNPDGTMNLADNQIIILFELGTTNLNSAAADFQDLVILVTLVRAPEGTEEESLQEVVSDYNNANSNGNNGHGNNVDGVDSSNPGNAPFVDSNPSVDDEQGQGNTSTTSNNNSSNCNNNNSNNNNNRSQRRPWWMGWFR